MVGRCTKASRALQDGHGFLVSSCYVPVNELSLDTYMGPKSSLVSSRKLFGTMKPLFVEGNTIVRQINSPFKIK